MIRLVPMTEDDYEAFISWAIPDYAAEQVKSGAWEEETALEKAEQAFKGLLSGGLAAADQSFYVIQDETTEPDVGYVWFGIREEGGRKFVALYDILIHEAHRRRGYGRQALQAMEKQARAQDASRILLHVFGHNTGARALYQQAGYVERNLTMVRELT